MTRLLRAGLQQVSHGAETAVTGATTEPGLSQSQTSRCLPAAQAPSRSENVEDERKRRDVHKKPLTLRTLQPETQNPLRRSKVRHQSHGGHAGVIRIVRVWLPLPAAR